MFYFYLLTLFIKEADVYRQTRVTKNRKVVYVLKTMNFFHSRSTKVLFNYLGAIFCTTRIILEYDLNIVTMTGFKI